MFTGIIQDVGSVTHVDRTRGDWRFTIKTQLALTQKDIGASMACAGCCLTIVEIDGAHFAVDVSAQTLSKTKIGHWDTGTLVNLEPSLKIGEEWGGHFVSGHVDGLAVVKACQEIGDSLKIKVQAPPLLARMIAPQGCIALDGVSLTVNNVRGRVFHVNVIPHTRAHTSFANLRVEDHLHIEVDLIARYVQRLLERSRVL